jgi:hypothetical protein
MFKRTIFTDIVQGITAGATLAWFTANRITGKGII